MGWGDFPSADERAAEQRAANEAAQRARMTPFERLLLDVLKTLADTLSEIAADLKPVYEYDAATGMVRRLDTSDPGRAAGNASAEPVDDTDQRPGSARPDTDATLPADDSLAAIQDLGANAAAAQEFFPQSTKQNQP